jgi:hypothetical protein
MITVFAYFRQLIGVLPESQRFLGSATPFASPPPRPSIFSNYSFWVPALLAGVTGNSLHMQWPLTSQLHGSVS